MRGLFILFLLFSTYSLLRSQSKGYTDSKNFGLNGKVKSIREESYPAKRKGDKFTIDLLNIFGYNNYQFNNDGQLTRIDTDFKTDPDQSNINYVFEFENNTQVGFMKYDQDSHPVSNTIIHSISDYFYTCHTTYGSPDFNNYDTAYLSILFRDSIKTTHYYEKEDCYEQSLFSYLYNANNQEIERIYTQYLYKNGKLKFQKTFNFQYYYLSFDKVGNWTEREIINGRNRKTEGYEKREINYYKVQ